MAVTHTIRTTNEPAIERVVSHDEYEYLLELGLIYDGTPPVEPADSFDLRVAERLGLPDSATRAAIDGLIGDISGTTDASLLVSGTLPAARIADGSLTAAKMAADVATQAELDAAATAARARANHTGTQAASTITGLSTVATSGAYADLTGKPVISVAPTLPQERDFAYLRGINTQGGGGSQQDATRVPGTLGTDYFYNSASFYKFIRSRGHRLVRLDFLWERVQPTLGGPLDQTKLGELKAAVQRAADAGLLVLLDMKNYGRYWLANDTQVQFGAGITSANFADVWGKLALEFADQPAVAIWGLMNEPHDHPDYPSSFTASGTINAFTADVESWVGASGTTASWSSGALVGTETNTGAGTQIVTLESPQGSGAGTYNYPVGSTLEIEVEVPTSTPGTLWQVRPAIVTTAFGFEYGSFTSVPKGAATTKVYMPIPATVDGTDHRHLVVEFTGDGITGSAALVVKIHNVAVGTYTAATSTPWKDASQAAVTAIRATGDKRTIGVAGDDYSWTGGWVSINGNPWITDPADNFVYEAHQYFDPDNSGTYEDVTYSAANAAAVTGGFDDLTDRTLTYLGNFITWCTTHGVRGFISEVGWPNHESVDQWNAVGAAFYAACNTAGIGITYWGSGETMTPGYNQDAYANSTMTPQPQAKAVLEKSVNLSTPAGR